MEIFKQKMANAEKDLEQFLADSNYQVYKMSELRVPTNQKGYYIQTLTTLFSEYPTKYIHVTPEHVSLIGIKIPYNFNQWEILKQYQYKTKEELVENINSLIYSSNIETLWK